MSDPPTFEEESAASGRHAAVVRRGQQLLRRRRIFTSAGAVAAAAALAVGLLVGLPGDKPSRLKVNVVSPSTLVHPSTTVSPSTAQATTSGPPGTTGEPANTVPATATTTPPATTTPTTVSLSQADAQLSAYVAAEAAQEAAAAKAAGQTWNGYLHTQAVSDGGALVALAAFSYDPGAKPVRVLGYSAGRWTELAALPPVPGQGFVVPPGAAMNAYWLANFPGTAISVADATRDQRPDFLIPLDAADNVPGAVVSQDGTGAASTWRYVPFEEGTSPKLFYELGRSPRFDGSTLVSTYDNCQPSCAQGTNYTITWTYEPTSGVFWAPSPP